MTFFSFYAQPSCTPGRAAMQTGRIPNRSGMTTVAFQGQGGGLAGGGMDAGVGAEEGRLPDLLHRQVASRRGRLRAAQRAGLRRDEVRRPVSPQRLHLRATRPGSRTWTPKLREMFQKVTKGALSGKAGEKPKQDFKVNGQYVDTPDKGRGRHPVPRRLCREGGASSSWKRRRKIRQAVLHQRQLHEGPPAEPAARPTSSTSRCRRASMRTRSSSWTRASARSWTSCDELGLDKNTLVFYTTDNGAWQDVYPGRRLHAVPRHQGHGARRRQPRSRDCALARQDRAGVAGTTTSSAASTSWPPSPRSPASKLPKKDREGEPIIFDSYDMSPVLFGHRQVGPQGLVLLHRERADARVRPASATTRPSSTSVATTAHAPADLRSTPILAGRARRNMSPPCRRSSISGPTRRNATTSS